MDLLFAAKYPFSKEAKTILSKHSLSDDYDLAEAVFNQVIGWTKHNNPHSELKQMQNMSSHELEAKVLYFPLAKIMCGIAGKRALTSLALSFLRRTNYFLVNNAEDARRLMREFFGSENKMHVSQFLENKPSDISLSQTQLSGGMITVNEELASKLVSQKIYRDILAFNPPKMVGKNIRFFAGELKKEEQSTEQITGPVSFPAFPPCMRKIVKELESGEKVGHMPRFVLATFLANIGLTKKEIVKFYEKQPNFNLKKTEYYVSSLLGEKGGIKYTVPSCATIRSYGLCEKDNTCKWHHPLAYYRKMRRKV